MDVEKINSIIENDAKRYLSWWCNHTPNIFKIRMFQQTVDLMQKLSNQHGVLFTYNDEQLLFEVTQEMNQKTRVVADSQLGNACGAYEFGSNPPTITMNPQTKDSAIAQYGSAVHESVHRTQDKLVDTVHREDEKSSKYKFLMRMKANIAPIDECNVFGMRLEGRVYVGDRRYVDNYALRGLKRAFYLLSITERYASAFEKQCVEKIDPRSANIIETRMSGAYNFIRNRYNCNELSEREICNLVDQAHLNLYLGKGPTTELETRVMYDLAAALAYEQGHISELEYIKTANEKHVSKELAKWNVEHPQQRVPFGVNTMSEDLNDLNYLFWHQIKDLTPQELINNPKILARAIVDYGIKGLELLIDSEAFKDWCWSEKNTLSDSQLDTIAKYLGNDFSSSACRREINNRIAQRIEIQKQREIVERQQMAERYDIGHQSITKEENARNIGERKADDSREIK